MNPQSALDVGGPQAYRILVLWWVFAIVLAAVFAITLTLTLRPLLRRNREAAHPLDAPYMPPAAAEPGRKQFVMWATGISMAILISLMVVSIVAGRSLADRDAPSGSLAIEVVGNQWWWYFRYQNDNPSRILVTANEIHIPIGKPVVIYGTSHDVIHSLWVPGLHGKRDLIPSRITRQWFQADRPGRYRGQCAEFCGVQHANMAFWVIVEQQGQFDAWYEDQLRPARAPADPEQQRGQQVFLDSACVLCHAITGTPANGQTAPDLTHFASRMSIAAGTLPNVRGNLAGWISDPQGIKPGNHMAVVPIEPGDLQSLLAYLGNLR